MKEDASTQGQPRPATIPEEISANATPRLETAKSRVASFLTSFTRKKKTTPKNPPAAQDAPVRPTLFLDSKGKIVAAHPNSAGLFGRQSEELGGLNIKDLLKPGFDEGITNMLAKGKEANELSFQVLALRKDGSEFATQFSFKLLQDFRFRWAVFVRAPSGTNSGADQPARELRAVVPVTETATTETPDPASGENKNNGNQDAARQSLEAENGNLTESNAKARAELDKERETIKVSRKKEEVFQTQVQTLQGALEQAEARAHEGAPQSKDWEKKAANLKKCVDELTRRHASEQHAAIKAAQRVKELEEQLKRAGDSQAAAKKAGDNQNDTRHRLKSENRNLLEANEKTKADLDKERDAIKVALKKEEVLQTQVQKLQGAFEIAEAHARESAAQSKDWEKKAAELKQSVDELTERHAAEQNAAAQAAQRVKELEEQIKRTGDAQATDKKAGENQEDTRHRLKAENRNLIEANEKARADLDKERDAIKVSLKKEEELQAEVKKLQGALEQAESCSRESATQFKDWGKKAADLKKSVDDLTQKHAAEQNAAAKAAQRVKELEEQLNGAGDDRAAGKKDIEIQDTTRQRLEAEIRNLIEASEKTKTHLEKERVANTLSRKKQGELDAQIQKLQGTLEQAEARARESATQSKDWEKQAAEFRKSIDDLSQRHAAEQNAAAKAAQRIKELEEQLNRAGNDQAAGNKAGENQEDTRHFLKAENRNLIEANEKARADLNKERDAIKVSLKKEEELQVEVKKLQGALEEAEACSRESAAQSDDWKEKAAVLKKSVDELSHRHAAEQISAIKAAERVKELEEQLNRAGDDRAADKKDTEVQDAARQRLEAEIRNLIEASDKTKVHLEQERVANTLARKKQEELDAQIQKLQGTLEQAEARARESATQSNDWEKKADDLKKSVDELTCKHAAEQNTAAQAAQRVKELEEQLKRTGDDQAAGKKANEAQDAARQRLEAENRTLTEANAKASAELDKERDTIKVSRKKEEELQAQVQKIQGALEQAEARSRESATQSSDWEKKVADLKKSIDDLTQRHAAEQNAAIKAAQRVKELEDQLKRAGDDQASGKKAIEVQDSARQRLEAENRTLTEASAKAMAELDKERDAVNVSRKKEEELQAQVQKLKGALEQAEARTRESATQSSDWEKKVADLKKSVDEITRRHAAEQNAAVKAAQRVKELEEQLTRAGNDQAAGKKAVEAQETARQHLEAENRNLTEANAKARAELDKERDAIKVARKKEEELQAQVQKLQGALEQAEARARESAAQSKDWEKKAADLKKSVDDLTNNNAEQSAAAKRVRELEQQLKRAGDDLAAIKTENRNLTESVEKQAALEKNASELEQRARWSVFSLAKANAELETHRVERERAEKNASSAAAQIKELEEKLKRQVESERASQGKIAELEKTVEDRGDDLARASAEIEKETEERQTAQKQSRLVSEMGKLLESKLASFEEVKKALEASLKEKDERLKAVERSLAEAKSGLERESARRRRVEGLLDDARQQREKLSAEIFAEARGMYNDGLYSDCHDLLKELMGTLDERISIFSDALDLQTYTLTKLGRYTEARTEVQQRIKSIEDRLGKKHPSLIPPLNNLAAILEKTGFVFEAEQATRRVSSIQKNV